eukprot:UN01298
MELQKLGPDSLIGAFLAPDNNKRHYIGWIKGPEDTPYEDGVFLIDIELPAEYPFAPPKMKFSTHIWHPNVSSVTGAICLDTLKNEWSPALTMRTALLSVLALLTAANPTDPQDHVVAKQYLNEPAAFEKKAREWTIEHASQNLHYFKGTRVKTGGKASPTGVPAAPVKPALPPFKYQSELNQLLDMGFEEMMARSALEKSRGDVAQAINTLTQ